MTSGSTYEVLAVRYATREAPKREVFLGYHLYEEPDVTVGMDYFFWIARNEHRTVLIDSGFSAGGGARRGRTALASPLSLLPRLGLAAATVPQVIVTHAHFDHLGNVGALPRAEIVIARSELDFWLGPYAQRRQFSAYAERTEIDDLRSAADAGRVTYVQGQYSPAPGIEVVEVGGHTPGQAIVLVATAKGQAVLASDAVHFYEEYDRDRPFGIVADLVGMYRAYEVLREICQPAGSHLVAGHDPDVMRRFTACDGDLAGVAVRIG
jgi:glyoxylase-like metal-dependent hydrolase (beta-lactamase superfamily II)